MPCGKLADYTRYHFASEESLMQKTSYPSLVPHRSQHRLFVEKIEKFQRELDAGNSSQSIAISDFLNDWLLNHIQKTDRQYSGHMNARGVS
jgi:hemerythrin